MRSLLGEASCTQLIILQPRRHDRKIGVVLFVPCPFERAAVGLLLRRLLKRLRTFFTDAKENKYPLGKSAYDGKTPCRNEISPRRSILHTINHSAAGSGLQVKWCGVLYSLLLCGTPRILRGALWPNSKPKTTGSGLQCLYQKTPSPYNQSPSPAIRRCRLAGQRRQAFHSSRFHYWENCTPVAPSGCRS
jgi:hypothetical protein